MDSRYARLIAGSCAAIAVVKVNDPFYDMLAEEVQRIIIAAEKSIFEGHAADLLGSLGRGSSGLDEALAILTNDFRAELGPTVTDDILERVLLAYTRGTVDIVGSTRWEFNLTDEDALRWLQEDFTYWIGDYHGPGLSERVSQVMAPAFTEGLGPDAMRQRLVEAFGGYFSRSDAYWEGFSTNVVTRSRTFGTTEGLVRSGAVEGEFSAILDNTTSGICRAMDGRIIRVRDMVEQRDKILSLNDPESIKSVAPWRTSDEQVQDAVSFADAMGYVPADIQPPLHFHCRSTIIFRR